MRGEFLYVCLLFSYSGLCKCQKSSPDENIGKRYYKIRGRESVKIPVVLTKQIDWFEVNSKKKSFYFEVTISQQRLKTCKETLEDQTEIFSIPRNCTNKLVTLFSPNMIHRIFIDSDTFEFKDILKYEEFTFAEFVIHNTGRTEFYVRTFIKPQSNAPISLLKRRKISSPHATRVVCYYTIWSWYRPDIGKYTPEDIDPDLCTHIHYGYAILDPKQLIMKPKDNWSDIDNEFYTRVTSYQKNGVKVLISLGGWDDSSGDKYSRLVTDPAARANFVSKALAFCQQYSFAGIDIFWRYPVCHQYSCSDSYASDKVGYSAWVQELAEAFHPEGLLVSIAVPSDYFLIEKGYDVPAISAYIDYFNVLTFDYHGSWDGQTGLISPLYAYPENINPYLNTNYSINYLINSGADPKKLNLGIPFYGQSFTLTDPSSNGLSARSNGSGVPGTYTENKGLLSYYEICYNIKELSWTVVKDALEPYAYSGNQWVSYDDPEVVHTKAQYVKDRGLGGALIWALDLDDFMNRCGSGTYPLLKALNRVLRGYSE